MNQRDKYVVYGLGYLLSNQSPARGLRPQTQDGSLITVHVRAVPAADAPGGLAYRTDTITYMPTFCVIGTYRVVPVMTALADPRCNPVCAPSSKPR